MVVKTKIATATKLRWFYYIHPWFSILINTLNIGDKGASGSKPVKFEGAVGEIHFKDAKIDVNGWEPALTRYQFHGDNSGTIRNSKLLRCEKTIPYSLYIQVPKKDSLVFTNCLIEDQDVEIITTDFPKK